MRRRPPIASIVVGVVLAAALAFLAIVAGAMGAGRGASGSRGSGAVVQGLGSVGQQATRANLQPGINAATGLLLSLTVLPASAHKAAPEFTLTDQHGHPVSPGALRGKVVVITGNDDRCTDLCTLLAADVVAANHDLGRAASHVAWLSFNVNPYHPGVGAVRSWTDRHGLAGQANWLFANGSPRTLARVWSEYGVTVQADPKTRTVNHGTEMFFVDPGGVERAVAEFGPASADTALFAHGMAQMADDLLPASQRVHVAGPETPAPSGANATVGAVSPGWSLPYLAGGHGTFRLSSLRGRYAVVSFWSSTCTVCKAELPNIEAAYRADGRHVAFVGVDVSDPKAPALALARKAGLTYPLLADRQGAASGAEQILGLPFTLLLDPHGRVLMRHPGDITTEQLEYLIGNDASMGGY